MESVCVDVLRWIASGLALTLGACDILDRISELCCSSGCCRKMFRRALSQSEDSASSLLGVEVRLNVSGTMIVPGRLLGRLVLGEEVLLVVVREELGTGSVCDLFHTGWMSEQQKDKIVAFETHSGLSCRKWGRMSRGCT